MFERIELHNQALSLARLFHRPLSVIRFTDNGMAFEKSHTSYAHLLPVEIPLEEK